MQQQVRNPEYKHTRVYVYHFTNGAKHPVLTLRRRSGYGLQLEWEAKCHRTSTTGNSQLSLTQE